MRVIPAAVLSAGVRVAEAVAPLALDEAEFRAFHARTARSLAAYLRRSLPAEDVEDAVQEAYLRLLRTPHASLPIDERRAYLYRIAANLVNDAWRARKKAPTAGLDPDALPGRSSHPAAGVDMTRAMGRLRVQERTMLWLAYVEQASHREIASALSIKEGSVRVLLSRARQKLAVALGIRR
ncbi:RNA polymerase sigma factor [Luteitalea pratensis]|uniref:RNA polymerase sigma factor n=1 Tax=Luteitalea pratensis TaxID=1855912 RepID=A0A143PVD3_LUTPR|nr:sigma-70 family RNA polymerase sigma factor [Luteitalea pratensis]AMY12717.1 RNA polymerase sigma factor [Luteitalea pratensis]